MDDPIIHKSPHAGSDIDSLRISDPSLKGRVGRLDCFVASLLAMTDISSVYK